MLWAILIWVFERIRAHFRFLQATPLVITEEVKIEPLCSICYEPYTNRTSVQPCNHDFCLECIKTWLFQLSAGNSSTNCPYCRTLMVDLRHSFEENGSYESDLVYDLVPPPEISALLADVAIMRSRGPVAFRRPDEEFDRELLLSRYYQAIVERIDRVPEHLYENIEEDLYETSEDE